MSSSEGCVGGVEPETVKCRRWRVAGGGWSDWYPVRFHSHLSDSDDVQNFVHPDALRSVEEELRDRDVQIAVADQEHRELVEELRQAREERDAYRASWEREATDAARYRLHHEACVRQRDEARKAATGWVEDVSSMAARVDDMAGDLRACRAALDWYAKEDRYDVGRASSRPVVLADRGLLARRALAALSPVQGEHEQDGEARIYVTASEARLIGDAYFTGSPDALDRAHDVIARLADAADGRGESEPDGDTDA